MLLALAIVGLTVTLLPLVPTDAWWIRYLDYPRLQFTLVMLALLAVVIALPGHRGTRWLTATLLMIAVARNAVLLGPYLLPSVADAPSPSVDAASSCAPDHRLRILAANVQMGNHQGGRLIEMVRRAAPDIAWFQETDAWREEELAPLSQTLAHELVETQSNYYGIHLFSRLPFENGEVRYLTQSRNPSAFATATLPSGDKMRIYAIHPRPPQVGQSTAERDAQMIAVALEANADRLPHVVMGDMNTVPWEDIADRMQRIGGFEDPRFGRGLFVTWNANSTILKWPLDHIMPGPNWTLLRFEVLTTFGSDHRPLLAELCLRPREMRPPVVSPVELEQARETVSRGQGKAVDRDAARPPSAETGNGDAR